MKLNEASIIWGYQYLVSDYSNVIMQILLIYLRAQSVHIPCIVQCRFTNYIGRLVILKRNVVELSYIARANIVLTIFNY